jgi:hypothetical protein
MKVHIQVKAKVQVHVEIIHHVGKCFDNTLAL